MRQPVDVLLIAACIAVPMTATLLLALWPPASPPQLESWLPELLGLIGGYLLALAMRREEVGRAAAEQAGLPRKASRDWLGALDALGTIVAFVLIVVIATAEWLSAYPAWMRNSLRTLIWLLAGYQIEREIVNSLLAWLRRRRA